MLNFVKHTKALAEGRRLQVRAKRYIGQQKFTKSEDNLNLPKDNLKSVQKSDADGSNSNGNGVQGSQLETANLVAAIIRKICTAPNIQQLKKMSLREQLVTMVDEAKIDAIQKLRLYKLFRDGIERRKYYNQRRIIKGATNKHLQTNLLKKPIVYNPICMVTTQVINNIIFGTNTYQTSYGHYGISKTFGYCASKQLTDIIVEERVKVQQSLPAAIQKENIQYFQKAPKILYMSMSKSIGFEEFKIQLKKSFISQCPQIPKQQNLDKQNNLRILARKIVEFYQERDITVILVVDQINTVASVLRDYYIKQEDINKKNKYNEVSQMNQQRLMMMDYAKFTRVIYNSSINNQALIDTGKLSAQKNKGLMKFLNLQIKLVPQLQHSLQKAHEHRVLYPQILHFDSSAWSLADCLLFQLQDKVHPDRMPHYDRTEVFEAVKQLVKEVTVTPLQIRMAVDQFFLQMQSPQPKKKGVEEVLQQIKMSTKINLAQKFATFLNKLVQPKQRKQAIFKLYYKLSSTIFKSQKQEMDLSQDQADSQHKMQKKVRQLLSVLRTNSFSMADQNQSFRKAIANIDKHLFIYFTETGQLTKWLESFKGRIKAQLVSECTSQQQVKELDEILKVEVEKYKQQLLAKGGQKNFKIQLGLSFLPFGEIIKYLEPQIDQATTQFLSEYKIVMKEAISENMALYGIQLEKYLIKSLHQYNGNLSAPLLNDKNLVLQIKQQNNYESFTALNRLPNKTQMGKKQFLDQFVAKSLENKKLNKKTTLFTPVKDEGVRDYTSQAIDFVVTNYYQGTLYIAFFDVTASMDEQNIKNKIKRFLQCFEQFNKQIKQVKTSFGYYIVSGAHNYELVRDVTKKYNQIIRTETAEAIKQNVEKLFSEYNSISRQQNRQKSGRNQAKRQKSEPEQRVSQQEDMVEKIINHYDLYTLEGSIKSAKYSVAVPNYLSHLEQSRFKQLKEKIVVRLRERMKKYANLVSISVINSSNLEFSKQVDSKSAQAKFRILKQVADQYANQLKPKQKQAQALGDSAGQQQKSQKQKQQSGSQKQQNER